MDWLQPALISTSAARDFPGPETFLRRSFLAGMAVVSAVIGLATPMAAQTSSLRPAPEPPPAKAVVATAQRSWGEMEQLAEYLKREAAALQPRIQGISDDQGSGRAQAWDAHLQDILRDLNEIGNYRTTAIQFQAERESFERQVPLAASDLLAEFSQFPTPPHRSTAQRRDLVERIERYREMNSACQQQLSAEQLRLAAIDSDRRQGERNVTHFLPLATDSWENDPLARDVDKLRDWSQQLLGEARRKLADAERERVVAALGILPQQIDALEEAIRQLQLLERREGDAGENPSPSQTAAVDFEPRIGINLPTRLTGIDPLLDPNRPLVKSRLRIESRINQLQVEELQIKQTVASLKSKIEKLQQKIELTGMNKSNQLLLMETRRSMPTRQENRYQIKLLLDENRQQSLEELQLEEQLAGMRKVAGEGVAEDEGGGTRSLDLKCAEALAEKYKLYLTALGQLATEREHLDYELDRIGQYLDHQLLWVCESEPLSAAHFRKAAEGMALILSPVAWFDLGSQLWQRAVSRPYESILAVVGLTALGYGARRWKMS